MRSGTIVEIKSSGDVVLQGGKIEENQEEVQPEGMAVYNVKSIGSRTQREQ